MEKDVETRIKNAEKDSNEMKRVIEILKGKIFQQDRIIQSQSRKISSLETQINRILSLLKK